MARHPAEQEARNLQHRLLSMSLEEVNKYFDDNLRLGGTDVDLNRSDLQGDGDQSRVQRNHQIYRDMFAVGGDINHLADLQMAPLSTFARLCITGNVTLVQKKLEELAGKHQEKSEHPSPELIRVLETRETAMRLSPLLMICSMGKNISESDSDGQIRVAELLLKYGARPDARDVAGKTVCHYGMGAMATEMTIKVAGMCIRANESSHFFGKAVELKDLSNASMNGKVGVCKGFAASTGRRVVYLIQDEKTVALKTGNLKLLMDDIEAPSKLCDIPDRLGGVCLLEVIQSSREDVAKVLLNEHHADIDVPDSDGITPRSLAVETQLISPVSGLVLKAGAKQAQKALRKCANCKKEQPKNVVFQCCSKCKQANYCSRECQVTHWKEGGHKKECKAIVSKQGLAVVLDKPRQGSGYFATYSFQNNTRGSSTAPMREEEGYRKPSSVGVGEQFDIKVQGGGPNMPLMLYDKTREFNIQVTPESKGFRELRKSINAEPAWQGRKTFVAATFDGDGKCTVYPEMTSIHKW